MDSTRGRNLLYIFCLTAVLVFFSVSLILAFYLRKNTERFQELHQKCLDSDMVYSSLISELCFNRSLELKLEGELLDNIILIDSTGKKIDLYSMLNPKTIFFRFWDSSCFECLKEIIDEIRSTPQAGNVVFIGSFSSNYSYNEFKSTFKVSKLYMIDKGNTLSLSQNEELQIMYFFKTNIDKCFHKILAPSKGYLDYTRVYLKSQKAE